jgi:hypothetical protein
MCSYEYFFMIMFPSCFFKYFLGFNILLNLHILTYHSCIFSVIPCLHSVSEFFETFTPSCTYVSCTNLVQCWLGLKQASLGLHILVNALTFTWKQRLRTKLFWPLVSNSAKMSLYPSCFSFVFESYPNKLFVQIEGSCYHLWWLNGCIIRCISKFVKTHY